MALYSSCMASVMATKYASSFGYIVLHPVFDGPGCDGGKKCLFVFLALKARFEILDFRFQRFVADI